MGYSFYEIYTTSERAFKSMGYPFGADQDAAYIIAWLELNKFNGVNIFKKNFTETDHHFDGKLNHKKINNKIDFKNKSILMKGPGLIDFLQSDIYENNKISINLINCSNSILFLPLLYKVNNDIEYLELIFRNHDNKIHIYKIFENKVFFSIKENILNMNNNEVKITFSNEIPKKISEFYNEIINEKIIQENLLLTLTPNESDWDKVSIFAKRTFVPESEESRSKGAGGGDAND